MESANLLLAGLGLLLAGIVKGATGLGYASCALPFLVVTLGLKPAMVLVLVPAMATNVSVALSTGHLRETVARFTPMYLAMPPGIALGLFLLLWTRQSVAIAALGIVMVLYSVFALARPNLSIPVGLQASLQLPTGFLNGVMTGLTGSQVMPLFPYMMGLGLDSARLVQAINLAVMIASIVLGAGLAATGVLTPELLAFSLAAVAPALAGVEIGTRLRRKLPAERFRSVVLYVLLAMGCGMVLRSLPMEVGGALTGLPPV